jgi:CRISPR-associated exonuclease Cas4
LYTEEQLLPLSALQHFVFCERRAALVVTECLWAENQFTIEGTQLHERADDASQSQNLAAVRVERTVSLMSLRYGLTGKADVIEFHKGERENAYRVHVIEYKRGKPKKRLDLPFQVQLCAQALCVEDMLNCAVTDASIYYGKARQRKRVELDDSLRSTTINMIEKLHALIDSQRTPKPE